MRAPLSKDPFRDQMVANQSEDIENLDLLTILYSRKNVKWFYVFDREKRRGIKRRDDSTNVGVSEDAYVLLYVIRCWKRIKMKCTKWNWNNCIALISKSFDQVSGALYVFSIERARLLLFIQIITKRIRTKRVTQVTKIRKTGLHLTDWAKNCSLIIARWTLAIFLN